MRQISRPISSRGAVSASRSSEIATRGRVRLALRVFWSEIFRSQNRYPLLRNTRYTPVPLTTTASGAALPRIMSEALSAIIRVEALRLAEIMRGMIDASTTRRPCSPWTRNWSSTPECQKR